MKAPVFSFDYLSESRLDQCCNMRGDARPKCLMNAHALNNRKCVKKKFAGFGPHPATSKRSGAKPTEVISAVDQYRKNQVYKSEKIKMKTKIKIIIC